MTASRGLKVLQPQLPAQIDVNKAPKKTYTVVLTGEDFTANEVALPGLSVTVTLSVSFAKRKKMIALIESYDRDLSGPYQEFHAMDELIQMLKTVFLVNWNLVVNGKPIPIEDIEELEDDYLAAVVKASFKALQQGTSMDPNSGPS